MSGFNTTAPSTALKQVATGANEYAKEPYDEAAGDLELARAAYDGSRYEDSIDFAKRAIATLDAMPPKPVAVVEPAVEPAVEPVVEPVVEPAVEPTTPPLPAAT